MRENKVKCKRKVNVMKEGGERKREGKVLEEARKEFNIIERIGRESK